MAAKFAMLGTNERKLMAINNLNSYTGWIIEGRQVSTGSKAGHYLESPEGRLYGLFHLDQTEELRPPDLSWPIISAEERESRRKKTTSAGRLKLRIEASTNKQGRYKLLFWCGSNRVLIDLLRKSGYRFSGSDHRWVGYKDDPDAIIASLRAYKYEVEIDNDERTREAAI